MLGVLNVAVSNQNFQAKLLEAVVSGEKLASLLVTDSRFRSVASARRPHCPLVCWGGGSRSAKWQGGQMWSRSLGWYKYQSMHNVMHYFDAAEMEIFFCLCPKYSNIWCIYSIDRQGEVNRYSARIYLQRLFLFLWICFIICNMHTIFYIHVFRGTVCVVSFLIFVYIYIYVHELRWKHISFYSMSSKELIRFWKWRLQWYGTIWCQWPGSNDGSGAQRRITLAPCPWGPEGPACHSGLL